MIRVVEIADVSMAEVVLPGDRVLARIAAGSPHTYTDLLSACLPWFHELQRREREAVNDRLPKDRLNAVQAALLRATTTRQALPGVGRLVRTGRA